MEVAPAASAVVELDPGASMYRLDCGTSTDGESSSSPDPQLIDGMESESAAAEERVEKLLEELLDIGGMPNLGGGGGEDSADSNNSSANHEEGEEGCSEGGSQSQEQNKIREGRKADRTMEEEKAEGTVEEVDAEGVVGLSSPGKITNADVQSSKIENVNDRDMNEDVPPTEGLKETEKNSTSPIPINPSSERNSPLAQTGGEKTNRAAVSLRIPSMPSFKRASVTSTVTVPNTNTNTATSPSSRSPVKPNASSVNMNILKNVPKKPEPPGNSEQDQCNENNDRRENFVQESSPAEKAVNESQSHALLSSIVPELELQHNKHDCSSIASKSSDENSQEVPSRKEEHHEEDEKIKKQLSELESPTLESLLDKFRAQSTEPDVKRVEDELDEETETKTSDLDITKLKPASLPEVKEKEDENIENPTSPLESTKPEYSLDKTKDRTSGSDATENEDEETIKTQMGELQRTKSASVLDSSKAQSLGAYAKENDEEKLRRQASPLESTKSVYSPEKPKDRSSEPDSKENENKETERQTSDLKTTTPEISLLDKPKAHLQSPRPDATDGEPNNVNDATPKKPTMIIEIISSDEDEEKSTAGSVKKASDLAPKPNIISSSPKKTITASPKKNVRVSPRKNVTASPEKNIASSPKKNIESSPKKNIAASPNQNIILSSPTQKKQYKSEITVFGQQIMSDNYPKTYVKAELNKYKCLVCGQGGFAQFNDLKYHREHMHHNVPFKANEEMPFGCGVCGKPFHLREDALVCAILAHEATSLHQQMFQYACSQCPKDRLGFHSVIALTKHWEVYHLQTFLQSKSVGGRGSCDTEEDALPTVVINETEALKIRAGELPITNIFPLIVEKDLIILENDKTVGPKNPNQVHLCTICHIVLKNNYELNNHMMKHTAREARKTVYKCNRCPEKFKRLNDLRHHYSIHLKTSKRSKRLGKNVDKRVMTKKSDGVSAKISRGQASSNGGGVVERKRGRPRKFSKSTPKDGMSATPLSTQSNAADETTSATLGSQSNSKQVKSRKVFKCNLCTDADPKAFTTIKALQCHKRTAHQLHPMRKKLLEKIAGKLHSNIIQNPGYVLLYDVKKKPDFAKYVGKRLVGSAGGETSRARAESENNRHSKKAVLPVPTESGDANENGLKNINSLKQLGSTNIVPQVTPRRKFQCKVCHRYFTKQRFLNKHETTHTERPKNETNLRENDDVEVVEESTLKRGRGRPKKDLITRVSSIALSFMKNTEDSFTNEISPEVADTMHEPKEEVEVAATSSVVNRKGPGRGRPLKRKHIGQPTPITSINMVKEKVKQKCTFTKTIAIGKLKPLEKLELHLDGHSPEVNKVPERRSSESKGKRESKRTPSQNSPGMDWSPERLRRKSISSPKREYVPEVKVKNEENVRLIIPQKRGPGRPSTKRVSAESYKPSPTPSSPSASLLITKEIQIVLTRCDGSVLSSSNKPKHQKSTFPVPSSSKATNAIAKIGDGQLNSGRKRKYSKAGARNDHFKPPHNSTPAFVANPKPVTCQMLMFKKHEHNFVNIEKSFIPPPKVQVKVEVDLDKPIPSVSTRQPETYKKSTLKRVRGRTTDEEEAAVFKKIKKEYPDTYGNIKRERRSPSPNLNDSNSPISNSTDAVVLGLTTCQICYRSFDSQKSLKKHFMMAHMIGSRSPVKARKTPTRTVGPSPKKEKNIERSTKHLSTVNLKKSKSGPVWLGPSDQKKGAGRPSKKQK